MLNKTCGGIKNSDPLSEAELYKLKLEDEVRKISEDPTKTDDEIIEASLEAARKWREYCDNMNVIRDNEEPPTLEVLLYGKTVKVFEKDGQLYSEDPPPLLDIIYD